MRSWLRIGVAILIIAAAATVVYRLIYANNPYRQGADLLTALFRPKSMLKSSLRNEVAPAPEIGTPGPLAAGGSTQGRPLDVRARGDQNQPVALNGGQQWFNTPEGLPLRISDLRGKVVIVDFWTYSCINCIRNIPYVSAWDRKYRDVGLVIIGVHTPEFAFEKKPENVARKIKEYGIAYPVVMDNDYAIWNAYDNQFWPAKYFINHEGQIVWRKFGEGGYEEQEAKIQELLAAAGLLTEKPPMEEPQESVDFGRIKTPEIYFGYRRISHFGGRVMPDQSVTFASEPAAVAENMFYLTGTWRMGPEQAMLESANGKIIIRYRANKANIVMAAEAEVTVEVRLDGKPLGSDNRGRDVFMTKGAGSYARIQEPKLYNFTDTGDDYGWHTLELIFTQPGVQAFAFTFG